MALHVADGHLSNAAVLMFCAAIPTYDGLKWMGVVSCGIAIICVPPLYFPMWGGMFLPAKAGVTEEDFYYNEYTDAEREQGLHLASSHFVSAQPSSTSCCLFRCRHASN